MIPPKILSIDDSKMIHRVIDKSFKPYECELFFAFNGEEGLAAAARELPNVIILDITMPIMDGFETLARLKADPTLKSIPVIMLTAEAGSENVLKIAKMGVRDYVVKPFTEEALLERVGRFVKLNVKTAIDSAPKKLGDALTLLVLDDQPGIIEAVRSAVAGHPWTVSGFTDGKEAAAQAVKQPPDLALVSLALPNRMPLNFLQVLRANAATHGLPILGLSAETEEDEQSAARRAGFTGIVTKPIQPEDLLAAVLQALKINPGSRFIRAEDLIHFATLPAALSTSISAAIRREFDETVVGPAASGSRKMVLDASAVVQADMVALDLILALLQGCATAKIDVRIVGSNSLAQQARGITETAKLVFYQNRVEALASFNTAQAA